MLNSSKNTIGARIFPVIPSPTAIPAAITQNQTILLNLAFQQKIGADSPSERTAKEIVLKVKE